MIKSLIKNIRQKPKSTRDNIALGLAGVFTAIISMIWLYNLPARYSALEEEHKEKESSGFASLFSGFKDQFASVKEATPEEVEPTSTIDIQDNRTNVGDGNVPIQDWALQNTSNVENSTTSSSSVSQYGFATSSQKVQSTESSNRPIRIITISNASTTATSSAPGQ